MEGELVLKRIPATDKSVLSNLMQLCQHDYSEFNGEEVNSHGLFGYPYLDHYWTEAGRHPFFMLVADKLAGFALIRTLPAIGDDVPLYSLAEFFILRKYRRQGIGQRAARLIFEQFPGRWRIGQEANNVIAQRFWRKVISAHVGDQYDEMRGSADGDILQTFQSGDVAPRAP